MMLSHSSRVLLLHMVIFYHRILYFTFRSSLFFAWICSIAFSFLLVEVEINIATVQKYTFALNATLHWSYISDLCTSSWFITDFDWFLCRFKRFRKLNVSFLLPVDRHYALLSLRRTVSLALCVDVSYFEILTGICSISRGTLRGSKVATYGASVQNWWQLSIFQPCLQLVTWCTMTFIP